MMLRKLYISLFVLAVVVTGSAVVQAAEFDLIAANSSATVNGAIFSTTEMQPTGTGVIDPFLRLQANGTEQGLNTSASSVPYDDKAGIWTHDLLLSNLSTVTVNGTSYYQFLLDINQTSANPLLSLDQLKLYSSNLASATNISDLGNPVYDLGNNWLKLNYALNSGSGAGDLFAYIPSSLFSNTHVYLYSQFGSNNASNDGFEEWAALSVPSQVPEPGMMFLLGSGLIGLAGFVRKFRV